MAIDINNTVMKDEIEKIRQEIPALACLQDDALFNLVCFKYFYNNVEATNRLQFIFHLLIFLHLQGSWVTSCSIFFAKPPSEVSL